ncbi:mitotic checkpoint serine/threonine-protein kinase BUB1-like [Ylistrum balloti]|uniref:mitotic checkpoint serine/threonine-protein kinase BUB1-like n=1 Tax=Ylistrum balloti TaxID=509963 RepID=UPI0029059C98|nr:mitotic checkpoint serine/threonine-protein kinase BUB1-like [Ylistrum balloti]
MVMKGCLQTEPDRDGVMKGCLQTEPERDGVKMVGCIQTKPERDGVMMVGCLQTEPDRDGVMMVGCLQTEPEKDGVMMVGCLQTEPERDRVMMVGCLQTEPEKDWVMMVGCLQTKPERDGVVMVGCLQIEPERDVVVMMVGCLQIEPERDGVMMVGCLQIEPERDVVMTIEPERDMVIMVGCLEIEPERDVVMMVNCLSTDRTRKGWGDDGRWTVCLHIEPEMDGAMMTGWLQSRKGWREFEEELQTYNGNDPFEVWHRYMLRIEKYSPENEKESNLVELLDRCFRTFNNIAHYKNDQRYVSAWIKYAGFCKEPLEIYSYMQKQGIGVTLAIFYEAWANATRQLGSFQNADLILQEGIRCQAQPLNQLCRKREELQRKQLLDSKAAGPRVGYSKLSSKDGHIQVFNDENVNPNMPAQAKGQIQKYNDENVNSNLAPKVQMISNENLKPSLPSQVHNDENVNPNNSSQRVMYCKEKLLMGVEELSFEELHARHWWAKRKREKEIQAFIDEEKRGLEEEKRQFMEEMEKNRAMLVQEAEKIKQERDRLRQEQEAMRLQCQQQMQQVQAKMERESGAMKHLNFGGNNSARSDLISQGSATGDQTEDFGLRPITSQSFGSGDKREGVLNPSSRNTPVDHSLSTPNDSQTSLRQFSSGRPSLTAPSPTVNTKEALQLVQGFFNASLDLEKDLGWGGDVEVPQKNDNQNDVQPVEPPKASGGLMFAIYDETQEKENASAAVRKNIDHVDKENCGLPQIPRQNLVCSVKPLTQKSRPPSLPKKMEFSVLQDGDTQMEGIESQAMDDCTIAPVGSHLSFAAAAHIASTPFNANNSHGPQTTFTLDLEEEVNKKSEKEEKSAHESVGTTYQDAAMQPNNLSPIMEGSNEESSGHQTGMSVGGDSVFHSSRGRHPSTDQKPDCHYPTDLDNHNDSVHLIDTSGYVPLDLDEKTEALLSMSIRIDPHNPFDSDTIREFLTNLPKPLTLYPNYVDCHDETMQTVTAETIVSFGGDPYTVESLVGKGGYASVYKASYIDLACEGPNGVGQDELFAMKIQKPGNPWEFYICSVIPERLRNLQAPVDSQAMMSVQKGYFFHDSSCLITKYFELGTLLDLVNLVKREKQQVPESVAMYCTIELIRVVESLQRCEIIHGDIKPDNFLVQGLESLPVSSDPNVVFGGHHRPFQLIDFGQSIDMTKYPPGTTFMAQVKTSGFQCIEMKTNMPWTYQTDMFGLAGTIHVLVFGQYMKVYKANDEWRINSSFNRSWNSLWKNFFHTMLNIPSSYELPDLGKIRRQFELHFIENLLENFNNHQSKLRFLMMKQLI